MRLRLLMLKLGCTVIQSNQKGAKSWTRITYRHPAGVNVSDSREETARTGYDERGRDINQRRTKCVYENND